MLLLNLSPRHLSLSGGFWWRRRRNLECLLSRRDLPPFSSGSGREMSVTRRPLSQTLHVWMALHKSPGPPEHVLHRADSGAQRRTAVTAHLKSEQFAPFAFARRNRSVGRRRSNLSGRSQFRHDQIKVRARESIKSSQKSTCKYLARQIGQIITPGRFTSLHAKAVQYQISGKTLKNDSRCQT